MLAESIVAADNQHSARIVDVHVLGPAADHRAFANLIVRAQSRSAFDDCSSFQPTSVADDCPRLHHTERSHDDVPTKLRPRIDHSGGVNLGHGCPFLGPASCGVIRRIRSGSILLPSLAAGSRRYLVKSASCRGAPLTIAV